MREEKLSIVEVGAVEGKGNYTSFPVLCSYLQLDMNLQGEIVQSEIIVICSFCGLTSFACVPFTSASRFPLGSLHVFSVLFAACALALCSQRPLPPCHCPFCPPWQGRLLFPGKASLSSSVSSEPSVTSLGVLFLLLLLQAKIFFSLPVDA